MNNQGIEEPQKSYNQRVEMILDVLSREGFISVSELAGRLDMSEMTIRRDFDRLESEGLVRRTRGGAVPENRTQIDLNYQARQRLRAREKDSIGKLAAKMVTRGQRIFLDAGTTVLAIVKYLRGIDHLQIITNSIPAQMELMNYSSVEVILVGGNVLPLTLSTVGPIAQEMIANMRFDWAFLGTGGIDVNRGLTHSTLEEIPIKKTAAASAEKVAILADHTKFGQNALAMFMGFDKIDMIVTDQALPEVKLQLIQKSPKTQIFWPDRP